ncbi:lactase-like protein, partial [Sitodiplosis mosellana]|uniref:lactase-like protein n=1 Tax=Sitodiplosis mosellana TaxID=263140 RepID=UPI002443D6C4
RSYNRSIIVKYFEEYANLLYERFGDRVKYWITVNEPDHFCDFAYGNNYNAPGINAHGIGEYECGHNILKAHAVAYHRYRDHYYQRYKGRVGVAFSSYFYYSDTNDTATVDWAMQFSLGWMAHPIFGSAGGYPPIMITQIANNSNTEQPER